MKKSWPTEILYLPNEINVAASAQVLSYQLSNDILHKEFGLSFRLNATFLWIHYIADFVLLILSRTFIEIVVEFLVIEILGIFEMFPQTHLKIENQRFQLYYEWVSFFSIVMCCVG